MEKHYTKERIRDVVLILEQVGAMQTIREAGLEDFLNNALIRIAVVSMDDLIKEIHNISYELIAEIKQK